MNFFKSLRFRYLRFFLIGLAVIFAVETGVIIYINNSYLKDTGDYKGTVLTPTSSKIEIKTANLVSGAQNIAASHDGRYVAYEKNGALCVLDMTTNKIYNVQNVANAQVSYFKWIYNRNRLIIAEKTITGGDYYVKLYYYDMKDNTLTEIRNNDSDEAIPIDISNKTDEVTDIDMSPQMMKTYVKTTTKSGTSKISEIDAYVGISARSSTVSKNIGKIQMLKSQDKLLYENAGNGKVYMYGSKTAISADGSNTSLSILGFDSNDNVYMANTTGGATRTIYRGSYNGASGKWSWSTVKLDKAVSSVDIYIEYNGDIYYNDKANYTLVKSWPIIDSSGTSSETSSTTSSSKSSSSKSSSSKTSGSSSNTSSSSTKNGIEYTGKIISVFDTGFLAIDKNQITPYFFK